MLINRRILVFLGLAMTPTWRVLRSRWGVGSIALLLLVLWLAGFPLIRLTYGMVVMPLRSVQYYFSPHRLDAVRLGELTGLGARRHSFAAYLDRLGLWAVLRSLRHESLPLRGQAIALAIVQQESSFRFYVKNPSSTACGLYQLVAATGKAKELPWWRCMDPVENARAGTTYVKGSALASGEFGSDVRCAYLKHYYGPASSCAEDPLKIWQTIGNRMTGQAAVYLKALQRLEGERARRGIFGRLIPVVDPYLPFALLGLCCFGYRKFTRRRRTSN